MEMIQREETPRLGGFRRDKDKDTKGRIGPTSFLEQLERVMEGIPREESARLPSSDDPKGLWKGYPGKKPLD
jgi:hypothetical protein